MKYRVYFSASKIGGAVAANYDAFFEKAKSLGATWDGSFLYLPEADRIRIAIKNAANEAGLKLVSAEIQTKSNQSD